MSTPELKQKWKFRDRLINSITTDGKFRVSILKATNLVETARNRHHLNSISIHMLGELLIGNVLMTSVLKAEERISIRLETDGDIKYISTEANAIGEVRGYMGNLNISPVGDSADEMIKNAIGNGFLHVTKTLYGNSRPVVSSVKLQSSSITEDLTYFFVKSEQVPTAIRMGIAFNEDGSIKEAAGFLVQALPEATEFDIKQMELNVLNMPPLTEQLHNKIYIDTIVNDILLGFEHKELFRRPVDFYCSCTKERFEESLKTLGNLELTEMMNDGNQELVCHFCNEKYNFSEDDLQKLIKW
jgi:molecular chaperone Hsp33